MKNGVAASPRPCLDGSLINAKSFLICSSFLLLEQRIHWVRAKLGCGRMLMGIYGLWHHLQNYFPSLWLRVGHVTVTLSTLISTRLSDGRGPGRSEVARECQGHNMWPEPPTCWNGQIRIPQIVFNRYKWSAGANGHKSTIRVYFFVLIRHFWCVY